MQTLTRANVKAASPVVSSCMNAVIRVHSKLQVYGASHEVSVRSPEGCTTRHCMIRVGGTYTKVLDMHATLALALMTHG